MRNSASEAVSDIYGYSATLLDGRSIELSGCRGHVVLIVNTASRCGFTRQYGGLEQLYRTYKDRGLLVFGFPCNQFGKQEPGSADEISVFCQQNYGVSFPVFAKIEVNGPGTHPLYQFLKHSRRGFLGMARIPWNFTKFLVDRKGRVVARFATARKPETLTAEIERLLAEPV